ncbi:Tripartite-type tricarboxylate transporter, receptor component TctC [Variovorax sp. PDC80]|uniref:Bug family tripartite tricarboxylate transporter substrate binding protein n=1 Tax=Variovorax sp. PDC80 TaxID=1882827 RepID=UPI0008F1B0DB|nr:tripartite tricarboxylate transporter substrate-binding protein [Variovorax sp. PDC80]SFN99273.1 Tripartite-type tricarboxylate transporter, receptor component TctC [Variovorax sp. PDC80]
MFSLSRPRRSVLASLGLAASLPGLALAQPATAFPDKPIKFLVGFSAGGGADAVARLIATKMATVLGQPIVVDNRSGAGGAIAAEAVAKSTPDGSTWLLVPSGHATQAVLRKSLPFHPVRDFTWVSTITTYPMLIGVRPDSPYKTFADVLKAAKQGAGTVSYSSAGVGTGHHLLGEWLNAEGNVAMTHVPFKGGAPALNEIVAGRVDLYIETMTLALSKVQSGQIRALAVSSAQPFPLLPSVPTLSATLPAVQYESWLGISVAPNTPSVIVNRINAELRKVLAQSEVQQKLAELGGQAAGSTPEQFREQVERDITKFGAIVETRKIERE